MRILTIISGVFLLIFLTVSATFSQQQFTQTVTAQNKNCNAVCSVIDIPELNNNPAAVIFITPIAANYPHRIGAYYMYLNKWSVFNLDGIAMVAGTTFNVEYYPSPDSSHFVYVAPPLAHSNDVRFLDHAGLNNNPNAQIRVFPTNSPPAGISGANFNTTEVRVDYDLSTSKWSIYNLGNTTVPTGTAYNVKFSSGGAVVINPNGDKILKPPFPASGCNCVIPTSLPPNGSAGGDLGGTYPYPKVTGLQGKPLSSDPPAVGQVLKWNGSAWEPANDNAGTGGGTGATYNAGTGLSLNGSTFSASTNSQIWNARQIASRPISNTAPTVGQVLKWNGTSWEPGSVAGAGAARPSVISFSQSNMVNMYDPNVNTKPIAGLDNQTFTLAQSSRVVFHTVIVARNFSDNLLQANVTAVWLRVEILNASNAIVGRATSNALFPVDIIQSINSSGIGILPAGTYHTRVSINRQAGGAKLDVIMPGLFTEADQGGQMIIEIFPD